jgi:hypothetical protein
MMKFPNFLLGIAMLFCFLSSADESVAEKIHEGSERFEWYGIKYRLDWKAQWLRTGIYNGEATKVTYDVYFEDQKVQPRTDNGGTVIGCRHTPPEKVRWLPFGEPQIGWQLILSGNCGNHNALKALFIVPDGDDYFPKFLAVEFMTKKPPIVEMVAENRVHIWSSYRETNGARWDLRFFVPELREIHRRKGYRYELLCPPLPGDVSEWPSDLPWRSFEGDFYAGLDQMNAPVMKSAMKVRTSELNELIEKYPKYLRASGFPTTKAGFEKLTADIAAFAKVRSSLSLLDDLIWGERAGRCP